MANKQKRCIGLRRWTTRRQKSLAIATGVFALTILLIFGGTGIWIIFSTPTVYVNPDHEVVAVFDGRGKPVESGRWDQILAGQYETVHVGHTVHVGLEYKPRRRPEP